MAVASSPSRVHSSSGAPSKVKEEARPAKKAEAVPQTPRTVDDLCRKYGMYGKLAQYETHVRNKDKKAAKKVEDEMWKIEKQVKNDSSLPESLRKSFVKYIEDKEDEIEKKY